MIFQVLHVFLKAWVKLLAAIRDSWLYSSLLCLFFYSVWAQFEYRVPGIFFYVMAPFSAVAFGVLGFSNLSKWFFPFVQNSQPLKTTLKISERVSFLVIGSFIVYGVLIYGNGVLSDGSSEAHKTKILSITRHDFKVGNILFYSMGRLEPWDGRAEPVAIMLWNKERKKLWAGEKVLVRMREGNLGFHWVQAIQRDDEEFFNEVISLSPSASVALKGLVNFYIDQKQYSEVSQALFNYQNQYPNDYEFSAYAAGMMGVAGYYAESVEILEKVVAAHPTYDNMQTLGWALSYNGNKKRAAKILESSIPLNPGYWRAYYHLGYVYKDLRDLPRALSMFEKVLELKGPFPEVEKEVSGLKKRLARYQ